MSQGLINALDNWESLVASNQANYASLLTTLETYTNDIIVMQSDIVDLYGQLNSAYQIKGARQQQGLDTTAVDAQINALNLSITSKQVDEGTQQDSIDSINIQLRQIVHSLFFTSEVSYNNIEQDVTDMLATIEDISSNWKNVYNFTTTYPYFDATLLTTLTPTIDALLLTVKGQINTLLTALDTGFSSYPPSASDQTLLAGYIDAIILSLTNLYGDFQSIIPSTDITISINGMVVELTSFLPILSYSGNMTQAQFLELNSYIYENTYVNNNLVITDQMTPADIQAQSQQLYDQSLVVLAKTCKPRYEFSGEFSNFIVLPEFAQFTSELELGKVITIQKDENTVIEAVLLELSITYDNPTDTINTPAPNYTSPLSGSLQVTFGNSLRLDNPTFIYSDILGKAAQLASDLDVLNPTGSVTTNIFGGTGLANGTRQYQVIVTGPPPYTAYFSNFLLDGTRDGKTILSVAPDKTLTIISAGTYKILMGATNTAIGGDSFNSTPVGDYNTVYGAGALESLNNANADGNTAIGYQSLNKATSPTFNVAIGYQANYNAVYGNYNVAIGYQSMYNMTGTDNNIAIGEFALYGAPNSMGSSNIALGYFTQNGNDGGDYNIGIGDQALSQNGSGDHNIAIGYKTLYWNGNAGASNIDYNIGIGSQALFSNATGTRNVAIGYMALYGNVSANNYNVYNNTAIGYYAMKNNQTGHDNIAIGYSVGTDLLTGSNNTIIGSNLSGLSSSLSDTVIIADGAGIIRFYSDATLKGQLRTGITTAKILTLTSTDTYNLTVPGTGTLVLGSTGVTSGHIAVFNGDGYHITDGGAPGGLGDTGITGDTGIQGDTGTQGDTGLPGSAVAKGDTGIQGDTGTNGINGTTGVQGDTGIPGSFAGQGDTGLKGDTGINGVNGDTGIQGNTGIAGSFAGQGDTGAKGDTGTSGTNGNTGIKGDTGSQGSTGIGGEVTYHNISITLSNPGADPPSFGAGPYMITDDATNAIWSFTIPSPPPNNGYIELPVATESSKEITVINGEVTLPMYIYLNGGSNFSFSLLGKQFARFISDGSNWHPILGNITEETVDLTIGGGNQTAYPTVSRILFGDDYLALKEKYDDCFAITYHNTSDFLIAGWDTTYSNIVHKFGDIDNEDHGNFITVDLHGLGIPILSAVPAYVEGYVYYDSTLHKLRVGGVAGWQTITSV